KDELLIFSKEIAKNIYDNRLVRNGLYIPLDDIDSFAKKNGIKLDNLEMRSRSLLNRDGDGRYKFSHRSILEYFIALELIDGHNFNNMNFDGMENVRLFLTEMGIDKHLNRFFKKYPDFKIYYCTSNGNFNSINKVFGLNLKLLQNITFIRFDKKFFRDPEIKQIILSFPSLNIFTNYRSSIQESNTLHKELLAKKEYLIFL